MAQHTKDKLADALRDIPGMPTIMITRAEEGYYHDFLSPLALPELQLVTDLRAIAIHPATPLASKRRVQQMIQQVVDGEFGASPEEGDEWMKSPEGQETMRLLHRPPELGRH